MAYMIYTTVKDENEAEMIANTLLEKRLIACANIFPIRSIYSWKGKIEDENEVAMIMKTTHNLVDRIMKEIKAVHNYEIPCIVGYQIDKGDRNYLNWIRDCVDFAPDLDV